MKKVYLDVDEEITSVIDRLKEENDEEISLVVPKESGLVQSVVNLKLIKKEAEKLKKTITIITANKIGRSLAENVGLNALSGSAENKSPTKIEPKFGEKVEIDYREEPKEKEGEESVFKKGEIKDEVLLKEEDEKKDKDISEKPALEKSSLSDGKEPVKKGKFKVNSFFVFLAAAFISLFVFGYFYIPRAKITVQVKSERKDFETDITVDKNEPETKVDTGIVTAELIEIEKDFSKRFNSSGKKNVGTKAKGSIKITNLFSTSSQTLVSGTRFESSGLIFKSTETATVPGYTDPGGGKVAGTINVSVEADDVGTQYNIGPSSFNIPGFQGSGKYDSIKGASTSAMTGGESREIKIVTQSDINQSKEDYLKEAEEEAKKEMIAKAKKDFSVTDDTSEIKLISAITDPKVGEEGSTFNLTLKISAKGLAYKEKDISDVFNKKAQDEVGTQKKVIDDGFSEGEKKVTKLDLSNGSFTMNITSKISLGNIIDNKKVLVEIMGQTEKKSREYLENLENVEGVKIDFWPRFIKRIPRIEKHVTIKTEAISSDEEKKSE